MSTPPRAGRREWIGLAALCLPCMLVVMDLSVLFLAVPSLSADLEPSSTELLWITDVYGFLIAGALIIMGTLGDRIGRRKVLLLGSAAFGLTSVGAALSTSPEMLIVARGLQGIAGATLIPSTMSLLFGMFPHEGDRMRAMGLISMGFTGGAALGPIVGGILLDVTSWHAVFLINVPAMAGVILLVPRFVPEMANPDAPRVDIPSGGLLVAGVLLATYGLKKLARNDGGTALAATLMVVGLGILAIFLVRQKRLTDPLLRLELFRNPVFSTTLATLMLTTFAMFGIFFFVSQYFQLVLDLSPLTAALYSLPGIVVMTLGTTMVVPRLAQRHRPGMIIAGGAAIMVAGLGAVALVGVGTAPWVVAGLLAVFQGGVAPIVTLGNTLVLSAAPPEFTGAASGTAQTANELSGALGIALLGSLGTALYRGKVADAPVTGVSAGDASRVHDTLAGAAGVSDRIPGELLDAARHAFVDGMTVVAVLTALAMVAVVVVALRRLGDVPVPAGGPHGAPVEEPGLVAAG